MGLKRMDNVGIVVEDLAATIDFFREVPERPVNALGYLRVMFAVDDIDETLERLRKRGAQLVGEVVRYKDAYRLCYIRGPEGLLIGPAQELS
jgi:catechol 2,3-dioxygenase-like lactoylglutathione lyase family enzyme